jgi:putative FmdB family regulatory protein
MPIYEYECPACGRVFSELLPIGAPGVPPCPRCGSTTAQKRLARFAVGRTESERQAALAERAAGVDRGSRRDIARFFQESGGGVGDDAFREVVDRAAAGATDADMGDVVRDVPVRGREEALAKHHAAHHAAHRDD